jgi:hypothetical protein
MNYKKNICTVISYKITHRRKIKMKLKILSTAGLALTATHCFASAQSNKPKPVEAQTATHATYSPTVTNLSLPASWTGIIPMIPHHQFAIPTYITGTQTNTDFKSDEEQNKYWGRLLQIDDITATDSPDEPTVSLTIILLATLSTAVITITCITVCCCDPECCKLKSNVHPERVTPENHDLPESSKSESNANTEKKQPGNQRVTPKSPDSSTISSNSENADSN